MAHPISARIVLLALAAALAASLVFAMIVAEHRDLDGREPAGAAPERVLAPAADAAPGDTVTARLRTVRTAAGR